MQDVSIVALTSASWGDTTTGEQGLCYGERAKTCNDVGGQGRVRGEKCDSDNAPSDPRTLFTVGIANF